jgi:hypothetical protein
VPRRPPASRFPLSALLAAVLLLAIGWGTGLAAEERTAPWELRVVPPGQPLARAIDLETIENVTAIVFDAPSTELELRIEQSDNDSDLVVRNDSRETIVVPLLRAAKVIHEVPLESDESWYFHPE